MKKSIIKVEDLCKTYNSNGEGVHIIKNINLDIHEGEFTVVMGSSGSGKSTLLYLLSGLDKMTSGNITVVSKNISNLKKKEMVEFRRKDISFVYQGINLVPSLNLFENIVLPGYLVEKNKNLVNKRAEDLLKKFEIFNQKKNLPSQVSGGQQQRAAIARALINDPKIIFADEPTGALNSTSGENVLDILTELNENGLSIVMVTHDFKAAVRAHRILFIKDGRIHGDLYLGKYKDEFRENREKEVFSYLKGMGF